MKKLSANISIGQFTFTSVVEVSIESSWDMLTDMCTLVLPRKVKWRGKYVALGESALIRVGDSVTVQLGYDSELSQMFEGYVTNISTTTPVEIKCQDAMWKLKQNAVTASFQNTDLHTLLSTILPSDVPFNAPTVALGLFRVSNATAAKVLEVIKKKYFLKSFFKDGTLQVGFAYVADLQIEKTIHFQKRVPAGGNELSFQRAEDIKIKLKMISINDDQKVEYEAGESDGEQRTMYYYDYSLEDMKAIADSEIERLKYSGYRGQLTILGDNFNHGDIVNLKDDAYPEREGRYLIKKVDTSFGLNGFRQTLHLDQKI